MAFSHTTMGRILGVGRTARSQSSQAGGNDGVIYENASEGVRLRRVQDTSMNAVAARHNAAMIYGSANISPEFTMRNLIEVRGADGSWSPVTGRNRAQPNLEAQIAALDTWRETGRTGQIGGTGPASSSGSGGELGRPDPRNADLIEAATSTTRPERRPSLIERSGPTISPHPPQYSPPTQNPHPPIVQQALPNMLPVQRAAAQNRAMQGIQFVQPQPTNPNSQSVLGWTDDARASRSFGRSAYLSGIITGSTNF